MKKRVIPIPSREGRLIRRVDVPMRDGARLATTVWLPSGDGPFPVLLVRSAYNRQGCWDPWLLERGIACVAQDCRGRYESEGEHYPFIDEAEDGYDTLEWLCRQPWCNGTVGMSGDSYLAATQFYTAPLAHPCLKALNPRFMAGDCWKRAYYCDGAFSLALTWSWLCFECAGRVSQAGLMPRLDVAALLRRLPIMKLDEFSGIGPVKSYRDYVRHNHYDAHWRRINARDHLAQFKMPVFLIGGWYDYYAGETFANFCELRKHAETPELRDSHRLLLGPWTHGFNGSTTLGELDFGPDSTRENDATRRWLDALLHDRGPSACQAAPIRLFVMGLNQWRDEYEWPLARTRYTPYYLQPGGGLSAQPPPADGGTTGYAYDPADPAPTLGGNHSVGPYNPGLYDFCKPGPFDQRPLEQRSDVRTFTSPVLEADTEVTGPVEVILYAASSARDTDFVVKLLDVYPDGRAMNITEGVVRARFHRDVWAEPELLEPGEVYRFRVDLAATSNLFRCGHRIRVLVTSSNFPLLDRNLNTGNDPATDTEMQVAEQMLCHDAVRASHILLPVIP